MSGDLIEVVILAGIFLLSALLGGKKKKRGAPTAPAARAPQVRRGPAGGAAGGVAARPAQRPQVRAPHQASVTPGPSMGSAPARRTERPRSPESMVRDLVELLAEQQHARTAPSAPQRPEPPIRREAVPGIEATQVEAISLETLEPAGGASHERFHERYIRALPEVRRRARHPLVLAVDDRTAVRKAIVWAEILGPPKGWS